MLPARATSSVCTYTPPVGWCVRVRDDLTIVVRCGDVEIVPTVCPFLPADPVTRFARAQRLADALNRIYGHAE